MCLAVPARIIAVDPAGLEAKADFGGIEKEIDVSLIEEPKPGDWVIVHVGFALNRIDEKEAEETLALLRSTGLSESGPTNERVPAKNAESASASGAAS